MQEAVVKIQKNVRGFLYRRKQTGTFGEYKSSEVGNAVPNNNDSLVMCSDPTTNEKSAAKGKITIQNFDDLISQITFDSPGKQANILEGGGSELASFRINLEEHTQSPNSFNQDPAIFMGSIPISPITCVPKNFTAQATSLNGLNPKVSTINIANHEDQDELDVSIGFLSTGMNKIKFQQFTPTFPVKEDERNLSWEDIKTTKVEYPTRKSNLDEMNSIININIPDFEDISGIPRASKTPSEGFFEFTKISESHENIDNYKNEFPEIKISEELPKARHFHTSIDEGKKRETEYVRKSDANDTLVFDNAMPIFEDNKAHELKRPIGKRSKIVITSSNPTFKPKNYLKIEERSSKNISLNQNTPIAVKKKTLPAHILQNPVNSEKIKLKKNFTEPAFDNSPVIAINKNRSKSKLPEIKKSDPRKKHKSEPKINPYSTEWCQQTLKIHFNSTMKLSNPSPNGKIHIKKLSKKKLL